MNPQRGFSIIAVVFILVVLAGLGAVIAQISATQHLGSALAQDGKQAWYAARAGLEWGRSKALAEPYSCANEHELSFEGFEVRVECAESGPYTEGNDPITVFTLTSTASKGGEIGKVTRTAKMNIWRPTP